MVLLSGDVLYGDVIIRTVGNREAEIENFHSILHYDETKLILQGRHHLVIINGECLVILCYADDLIRIRGTICEIVFQIAG